MVFFTLPQLANPAFIPPQGTAGLLPVARAVKDAAAIARAASPGAFVAPVLLPLAPALLVMPSAQDIWDAILGTLPQIEGGVPVPPQVRGRSYLVEAVHRMFRGGGIGNVDFPATISFRGELLQAGAFSVFNGAWGQTLAIYNSDLEQPEEIRLGSYNEGIYLPVRIVSFRVIDLSAGATDLVFPLGTPLRPMVPPESEPSRIVPLPVRLPAGGYTPYLVAPPFEIFDPPLIPYRPVPVLPSRSIPEPQRRLLPPGWFFPDGIQIGVNHDSDRVRQTIEGTYSGIDRDTLTEMPQLPVPRTNCIPVLPEEPDPGDCCSCDDIRDIVAEELDAKFPPARPTSIRSQAYGVASSHDILLPSFPRRAEIVFEEIPRNAKMEPGGGAAPDVYYAGWYSVARGNVGGDRRPLFYANQVINLEPGDKRLTLTTRFGYNCRVVIFYEQEDD